jgi:tRNA nucleotidyltransferase (CCA-adding enzyme)
MDEIPRAHGAMDGDEVLERLAEQPGGRELLEVGQRRADVALVGGAVRDLLLERVPRELDVVVSGDSSSLVAELAARVAHAQTTVHERFGTAVVRWGGGARIDVAERRAESYASPGALPDVRPGTVAEDLARRDFTVNAIAVPLGGPERGRMQAAENALADLAGRRLRILHTRSFSDDPTRVLRLARYGARLHFDVEDETATLAREALAARALETVSGGRIAAELWLAAAEGTLTSMGDAGVLDALGLPARFDEILMEEAAALLPPDGDGVVLAMAVAFHPPLADLRSVAAPGARERSARLADRFEFGAETRERVLSGAFDAPALAHAIEHAQRPSQLREALEGRYVEAIAVAGALGARRSPEIRERAVRWLGELRGVELEIGGEDLLAAGVPQGPEIGRRLEHALGRRLDGELEAGREAELAAALDPGA